MVSGWSDNGKTASKSFTIGGISFTGYFAWDSVSYGDKKISNMRFVMTYNKTTKIVYLNIGWSSTRTTNTVTIRILDANTVTQVL